jgi:outer membrane protein assembly factor BamB
VDDVLYASDVGQVLAFDAQEGGEPLWSYPAEANTGIGFYAAPVLDTERELVLAEGYQDQTIYALRVGDLGVGQTPVVAWTFPGVQAEEGAQGQYVGSGVIAGDLYIIGNGDGKVYALRLEDGTLAWSFATGDRVWATPLVHENTVYVASLDKSLYALDLTNGSEKWSLETLGALPGAPVMAGGKLWVYGFGDQIYQVAPETGDVLWTFEGGEDWFWATPTVGEERIFFSDVAGNVYAFDIDTQELVWKTEVGDVVRGQAVLGPEGNQLLVPGHERGLIYALDTATGDELPWGVVPDNPGRLPSDLVTDGERVFASPILTNSRVKAYDVVNGKLLWQYPTEESE